MDELLNNFEALRISALSKSALVNDHAGDVTLGPNSNTESISTHSSSTSLPTVELSSLPEDKTLTNGFHDRGLDKVPTYSMKEKAIAVALKTQEAKRQLEVKKRTEMRFKTFAEFDKALLERKKKFWEQHQAEMEKQIKREEYLIISTLEEIEATSLALFKEEQEIIHKQQLASAQLLSIKEEQFAHLQALAAKAKEIVKEHKGCVEDIDKVMKQNPEAADVLCKYATEVVDSCNAIDSFQKKINKKNVQLAPEDIQEAESQLNCAHALKNKIHAEIKASYEKREQEAAEKIALLKQKEAELAKEQAEAARQQEEQKKLAEAKTLAENEVVAVRDPSANERNMNPMYEKLIVFQQQHSLSFKQLLDDVSWKQFKFNCKKAVNLPVNAISATNAQHLRDKYDKLSNLLNGRAVVIGDAQVILTQHPQGIAFCKDLLAQKFVLQGDLTISSNPEAAFAYATIIVTLWNEFPDFGNLLLCYFYQACPYLIPMQIRRREGESDETYYRSLGYQYKDGVIEQQDKFLKRMTGISRLFFAIMITNPRSSQDAHPFNLRNAWSWLARTLNTEPYIDVTATLLFNFLEVAGSTMLDVYRRQFEKCIVYMNMYEIPKLKQKDSSGGPLVRLERMLTEYEKSKKFDPPSGILSPNFW